MTHRHQFRLRSLLSWPGLIVPLAVMVAGASIGAWLGTRSTAAASQYRLVPVNRTTLSQTLSTTGTIEPKTTANLSFSAPGQVTAVYVTVGQHVTDGQTLATMNSPTLQQQVAQATATLDQDQSRLSQDESGGASSAQITADRATVSADQSQADSARQALSGTKLVSPTTGIVTAVGYTASQQLAGGGGGGAGAGGGGGGGSGGGGGGGGGSASASGSAITVVSNADVVNGSVGASVVNEIKTGDQAMITADGANAPVTGIVGSVGLIASTSSGVATFPVVIDVTGTPSGLYAGASANVTIIYKQVADALVVPTAAVQPGPDGNSTVSLMINGRQIPRNVTTGIVSGGLTQITSGLTAGEQVVVTIVSINPGPLNGGGPGVFIGPKGRVIVPGGSGPIQVPAGG